MDTLIKALKILGALLLLALLLAMMILANMSPSPI